MFEMQDFSLPDVFLKAKEVTAIGTTRSCQHNVLSCAMPIPEQQRLYTQISSQLLAIGAQYFSELPEGASSLHMKRKNGKVQVQVYEKYGKLIGTVRNDSSSIAFRTALENAFAKIEFPDPNGVVATFPEPTNVRRIK
jgi:hypothetical protein